jgi:hypothetical protein
MDENQQNPKIERSDVLITIVFAIAIVVVVVDARVFAAIAVTAYAAVGILFVVRWLNGRDDPRCQEKPPDAP